MESSNRRHALVLGGSIAGLLAARVLAEEYASVTVVERDRLPDGAEHRRGLPHGHHVHGMLPRGLEILEELLPGVTRRITADGGLTGDILGNTRWQLNGHTLCRAHAGAPALSASRPLIEAAVRERVRALPNVTVDLSYTSGVFDDPDGLLGDDLVVVTARFPGRRRSAVMQRLEGRRILVTLAGVLGERTPETFDGFAAYARTLPTPDVSDVVTRATPVGAPAMFRVPAYVRHHYERLTRFPAGLLVTGDASCSFNPVYGQGMSVAAMNALALRDELAHGGEPDPYRYFTAVSGSLEAPWRFGVGADLALPGVTGPALPESPLTADYVGRLQLAAVGDPAVAIAFIRVTGLVDPPPALLRPEIAARVDAVTVG